jgi:fumarate hydratase subunit alpha
MIREFPVTGIRDEVERLLREAAYRLPGDYLAALEASAPVEPSPVGRQVIELLLENSAYAQAEQIPTCQDTGMAMLFLEVGQDVHFGGGDLNAAIQDGVRAAYAGLRKSVVGDPIQRANTGDNTPGLIHYEIVPGDRVTITALQKGFGAELMSRLQMFPPSVGVEGITRFVVETIELAGPNACIGGRIADCHQPHGHRSPGAGGTGYGPGRACRSRGHPHRRAAGGGQSQLFGSQAGAGGDMRYWVLDISQ